MPSAFLPHRLGFIMVTACLSVYFSGAAIYNFLFLPTAATELARQSPGGGRVTIQFLRVFFNVPWLLAVWSFLRAHCTDPGGITDRWRTFARQANLEVGESKQEWQPAQATWCTKCSDIRPERAHHCSATGRCAQRMDHYCPWTANCIGFRNHKFFLQVAFYTFLSNLVALATMAPMAVLILVRWSRQQHGPTVDDWKDILLTAACVAIVPVVMLFGQMNQDHIPRACQNVTSVEASYDNMPNPYDLGDSCLNMSQVMGKLGPDWLLPIMPWQPQSDGISFAHSDEAFGLEREDTGDSAESEDAVLRARYSVQTCAALAGTGKLLEDDEDSSICGSSDATDD